MWNRPCQRSSSQNLSKLPAENNSHSSPPSINCHGRPGHQLWNPRDLSPPKSHFFPAPNGPYLSRSFFFFLFWPPCWMRCTLISENADLCSKPPHRQFPRHGSTVYLFIFMLAKRRKSHRPKMNTNEMPSLASFVIRMKNRISTELQAVYFSPFPQPFSTPFFW